MKTLQRATSTDNIELPEVWCAGRVIPEDKEETEVDENDVDERAVKAAAAAMRRVKLIFQKST